MKYEVLISKALSYIKLDGVEMPNVRAVKIDADVNSIPTITVTQMGRFFPFKETRTRIDRATDTLEVVLETPEQKKPAAIEPTEIK